MVLAGGAAQVSDYSVAAKHWLAEFGPKAVALVHRVEHSGKTDDPDYVAFLDAYYHRHLCRLDPWPDWLVPLLEAIGQNPVYVHMNGPSEFDFTGTLAGLDLRKSLRKLAMPTLVTCGEYDEAPGWVAHKMASFMPHARVQVFKGLSHMSHIDDPAQVVGSTRRFIDTVA
jgi:proline-specific peptidase